MNIDSLVLKSLVNGFYTIQRNRIQIGNAVVANFKDKIGQDPGTSEEELEVDAKLLLQNLRRSYTRITDGVARLTPRNFKQDGHISTFSEIALIEMYDSLMEAEQDAEKRIQQAVKEFAIYTEFLEDVKGCGPMMSAVVISQFNIHKAEYPSSLHAYAGLDVVNGKGRSRQKEHLVDQTYTDKEGKEQTKKGISFNPFVKTKLVGVLGSSFIKAGGPYREVYDNYKTRLQNMPAHAEKTKGHIHNMAVRYMVKRFLTDLYKAWRALEGLPVAPEYSEAKLGIVHKVA
tara:strand:+ start:34 stop:894 length:861 start_codon:yes stop_codon:yes gene_type:complete